MMPSRAFYSEKLLFYNILFHSYAFFPQLHFYLFVGIKWALVNVQFKFENSFLCIYYCSKSHPRCLNKVSWLNRVLLELILCDEATLCVKYFFRASTFKGSLLFQSSYIRFRKSYFSRWYCFLANFRLLTLFLQLHFIFII